MRRKASKVAGNGDGGTVCCAELLRENKGGGRENENVSAGMERAKACSMKCALAWLGRTGQRVGDAWLAAGSTWRTSPATVGHRDGNSVRFS